MTKTRRKNSVSHPPIKRRKLKDPKGNTFTAYQQQLRSKLITVAIELFHRKGYEATTIADIMDVVGKTPRTFFRYFRSKDDVAFDYMHEQVDLVRSFLKSRPVTEAPMQSVRDAFFALADSYDADEQGRAKFFTRLILETPALNMRYYHEYVAFEVEFVKILARGRAISSKYVFALNAQISVVNAAFSLGLRAWAADGNHSLLRPWIEIAFVAFEDGRMQPVPSNNAPKSRAKRMAAYNYTGEA